jgi:hypothetical protein
MIRSFLAVEPEVAVAESVDSDSDSGRVKFQRINWVEHVKGYRCQAQSMESGSLPWLQGVKVAGGYRPLELGGV